MLEGKRRLGRRSSELLNDLKENRVCKKLKEEDLDRFLSRTRIGSHYGPVVKTEYTANRTSRKYCFSITKNKFSILFMKVITVGSGSHTEHLNTLCRQNVNLFHLETLVTYIHHCDWFWSWHSRVIFTWHISCHFIKCA
jgi:hypothetical protein